VMPCSVVVRYQSFGGLCCLRLSLHIKDGGSIVLRNVGILSQPYTASQLRRPRLISVIYSRSLCSKTFTSLYSWLKYLQILHCRDIHLAMCTRLKGKSI